MAPGRSYIVYPQGGGSNVVVLGPAAPANLWPGPFDSYNFAFSWWPSADPTAQTYNVYQGGIKIAQGVIPRPTYYYTAPFQLFQVVSGLSPNTTYSFYVTSVNQFGVEGLPSSPLTITTLNASNTAPTLPAAPLATYKPPYYLPTGGTTWTCTVTNETLSGGTPGPVTSNVNCSLQYALNHASYGDVFTLTAGANYVQNVIQGGFQVPATFAGSVANGPIYIQTTGYSSIPTPGVRIDPSYASHCANIQFGDATSGCGGWGITLNPGANNVRFVGINFVPVASTTTNLMYGCVQFIPSNIGYVATSTSNICFDRCLMGNSFANFGTTWSTVDCGLSNVNCNNLSVRDSYLYGFGASGNEGHGVQALGGSVHTYSNTYIEAVSEPIIYGGAYVGQTQIPSDITVEDDCTLCQPATLATATSPNVAHWAKNNFELKVGIRAQVIGNDLHYSLAGVVGSQVGRSVVLGCRDQMCSPNVNSTITGVSISGGYTTITDTSQSWAVNKWVNQWISDNTGSVSGACGIITSSTGNSVTFASVQQWGTVPTMNVGDNYSICNPPTWQCPWNTVSDVTVSGGTINNVGPMAVIFAADYNIVSSTKRILLNNIQAWEGCPQYTDPSYGVQKPNSHCLEISGCVQNITFDHNTAVANFANSINPTYSTSVYYSSTGAWNYSDRCVFSNSLLDGNYVFGDGIGGGFTAAAFATDFKNSSFQNNGFFAANPGGFPGTNFGIYSYTGAGMKNFSSNSTQPAAGDYQLASTSNYYTDSTTGGPLGVVPTANLMPVGNSGGFSASDYSGVMPTFQDQMMNSRGFQNTSGSAFTTVDANGWPTTDWSTGLFEGYNPASYPSWMYSGGSFLAFKGGYTSKGSGPTSVGGTETFATNNCVISNVVYNSGTKQVTFTLTPTSNVLCGFGVNGTTGGTPGVYLMLPAYSANTAYNVGGSISNLFTNEFISRIKPMSVQRGLDWSNALFNATTTSWAGRHTPTNTKSKYWADSSTTTTYVGGNQTTPEGWPVDWLEALCNQTNSGLWYNTPLLDDGTYATGLATHLAANLNSGLPVYVEVSNEVYFQTGVGNAIFPDTVASFIAANPGVLDWDNSCRFTGTTSNGSTTITGVSTLSSAIGTNDTLIGPGIPAGTAIQTISGSTITINNPAGVGFGTGTFAVCGNNMEPRYMGYRTALVGQALSSAFGAAYPSRAKAILTGPLYGGPNWYVQAFLAVQHNLGTPSNYINGISNAPYINRDNSLIPGDGVNHIGNNDTTANMLSQLTLNLAYQPYIYLCENLTILAMQSKMYTYAYEMGWANNGESSAVTNYTAAKNSSGAVTQGTINATLNAGYTSVNWTSWGVVDTGAVTDPGFAMSNSYNTFVTSGGAIYNALTTFSSGWTPTRNVVSGTGLNIVIDAINYADNNSTWTGWLSAGTYPYLGQLNSYSQGPYNTIGGIIGYLIRCTASVQAYYTVTVNWNTSGAGSDGTTSFERGDSTNGGTILATNVNITHGKASTNTVQTGVLLVPGWNYIILGRAGGGQNGIVPKSLTFN